MKENTVVEKVKSPNEALKRGNQMKCCVAVSFILNESNCDHQHWALGIEPMSMWKERELMIDK